MVWAGILVESFTESWDHLYMELLSSRKDKFNKEIKEGGPVISSLSIETRGPKKERSHDSHDKVSFQENHPCVAQCQREEATQMHRNILCL